MHDLEYSLVILSEIASKMEHQELSSLLKELAGASHEYLPSSETSGDLVQKIREIAVEVDPNIKI